MIVTIISREGRTYKAKVRLTGAYAITEAGLRFSRTTGKENANRRGRPQWRLHSTSLDAVRSN